MRVNLKKMALLLIISVMIIPIKCFAADVGKSTLKLTAKTIDGQAFDLASEHGNVVVINFWATWCSPCRAEMPALDEYYKKYKSQGLKVVAISVDDQSDDKLVKEVANEFSFPAVLSRDADYSDFTKIEHVPMTFVVDRKGVVRRDGNKEDPKINFLFLEEMVTPLLKEK